MSALAIVNLESSLGYINSKLDLLRENWEKFYRHYRINIEILKDDYPKDVEMSADILNFVRGTQQLLPNVWMKYLVKELTDTEILKKMDENAEGSI